MGKCIEKLPHSCGSSDGLQVFYTDGEYTGYCFSCSTYVPDPYEGNDTDKPAVNIKSPDEIAAEMALIESLSPHTLMERHLNRTTLDHFGVKVGVSEIDGSTPETVHFPYYKGGKLTGYKVRLLSRKMFWSVGDTKNCDMFGWKQAISSGAHTLYITEGEFDALAVFQVINKMQKGTKYEGIPAVVSLPAGSNSAKKSISAAAKEMRSRFKRVVLVFDEDEQGEAAKADAIAAYPGARTATLPAKDPNAALMEGRERALFNALTFNIQDVKNTRTVLLDSLIEQATQPVKPGLDFPWSKLTELTRGMRFGETYYIGAGVKMGKTDIASTFVAHFATEHNLPVYIANLEEANVKSTKKILGKVAKKVFHDPNIPFDPEDLRAAARLVEGKIHFIDAFQHTGWEYLREDIYNVVNNHGVKLVLIDPITNLTNKLTAGDVDTVLRGVAQDLAAMARDMDITVMIFCHCKAPITGPSHETGGKIYSSQFTGSRAMARSCNYMLGLEGNKDPDLPIEERNTRRLVMLEDREYGETGIVPLYWDVNTHLFNEIAE